MPDYHSNEPPEDVNGETYVHIEFGKAHVLKINEGANKITVLLHQYIEWEDMGIGAKYCHEGEAIKFHQSHLNKIWHADKEIFTHDLQDWMSLYRPLMYQQVYIAPFSNLRKDPVPRNFTTLSAKKDWTATLFCEFEFSLFPFDIQECQFRQFSTVPTIFLFLSPQKDMEDWKYETGGFDITIIHVGKSFNGSEAKKNSSQEIGFDMKIERIVQPYLYQYYLPCMSIVAVAEISFMIPLSAIPGRVALVVTQFLTLTNIFIHQMVSPLSRDM